MWLTHRHTLTHTHAHTHTCTHTHNPANALTHTHTTLAPGNPNNVFFPVGFTLGSLPSNHHLSEDALRS